MNSTQVQNLKRGWEWSPWRKPGDEDTRKKGKWMPGATRAHISSCQATFYLLVLVTLLSHKVLLAQGLTLP